MATDGSVEWFWPEADKDSVMGRAISARLNWA